MSIKIPQNEIQKKILSIGFEIESGNFLLMPEIDGMMVMPRSDEDYKYILNKDDVEMFHLETDFPPIAVKGQPKPVSRKLNDFVCEDDNKKLIISIDNNILDEIEVYREFCGDNSTLFRHSEFQYVCYDLNKSDDVLNVYLHICLNYLYSFLKRTNLIGSVVIRNVSNGKGKLLNLRKSNNPNIFFISTFEDIKNVPWAIQTTVRFKFQDTIIIYKYFVDLLNKNLYTKRYTKTIEALEKVNDRFPLSKNLYIWMFLVLFLAYSTFEDMIMKDKYLDKYKLTCSLRHSYNGLYRRFISGEENKKFRIFIKQYSVFIRNLFTDLSLTNNRLYIFIEKVARFTKISDPYKTSTKHIDSFDNTETILTEFRGFNTYLSRQTTENNPTLKLFGY